MVLYGLKTCNTCRKALKLMTKTKFVDVRAEGVPEDVMARAFSEFGDTLLNTRSTTWRSLSETERARTALELLAEYPALMKRPLIDNDGQLTLGWSADVQKTLGLS